MLRSPFTGNLLDKATAPAVKVTENAYFLADLKK